MIGPILIMIIILLYIDYYHKEYRIKRSKKNIKYRNSHSFYDDTDYSIYRPYREIYTYKILIIFLIILLIFEVIFPYKNNSAKKILNNNLINDIVFYENNETKQYNIGTYHKNYTKKIENIFLLNINMLSQNNFEYYNIAQFHEQINNINKLISEFNKYNPKDLEKKLYSLDIQKLYLLKEKYQIAVRLKNDNSNNQLINSLNSINHNLNKINNEYRIELIEIFNDINMKYEILNDGTIKFEYREK